MKKVLFVFLLLFFVCPIFVLAEQIDINSANLAQLDEIVHIGPKTAQKIIDGRPFSSVSDLSRVKGIGNGKYLQDIINQGFACVNCQTTQETTSSSSSADLISRNDEIKTYPSGVFINEILPNPKGPDSTDEWTELYNSNNFDIDLSGWQLQDQQGTITTFTISQNTKILANSYLVFKRPETNIMLNNDGDGLNLLTPDKNIEDSMSFVSAPLGQSYNKTNSGWQWSLTLTPGSKNIISVAEVKNSATSQTSLSKTKNSVKNNNIEAGVADISKSLDNNQDAKTANPWFLFFAALAITVILAVAVLLLKLKFFKKYVRT